jgi:RimJ/RimL family protein N-acetyltransferase
MDTDVLVRDVTAADVPIFFEQQQDPEAQRMVGHPTEGSADPVAFAAKWDRILADAGSIKKTVLVQGRVAGNILSFLASWSGRREVGYWLGREYWGKGVATAALAQMLELDRTRPLFASVASHNTASIRVLLKCGFQIQEQLQGAEDEVVLSLGSASNWVSGR